MTKATFKIKGEDPISKRLTSMLTNAKPAGLQSFLAKNIYQQYQQMQLARWKSGGDGSHTAQTSEGDTWPALNPNYLKWKRKKFAAADYAGNQMLVASGKLLKSVVGPGNGQNILISGTSMTIRTTVNYAPYVSMKRYFGSLGKPSMSIIKKSIVDYLRKS